MVNPISTKSVSVGFEREMINFASCVIAAAIALLAQPAAAQIGPPSRSLGPIVARTKDHISPQTGVRQLRDGRVLVNDPGNRRLLLFDSTLAVSTVVADSNPGSANSYGPRGGTLIPYRGDSVLLLDAASISFTLIDPGGKIVRVLSLPRPTDAGLLSQSAFGTPGFDAAGHLIYRSNFRVVFGPPAAGGGPPTPPVQPDSAPILRVDMATHQADTIATVRLPKPMQQSSSVTPDGKRVVAATINPLQLQDDWVVTSDGTIAIVRAQDYHIDWIGADGRVVSSPKLPHAWHRLDDAERKTIVDATRVIADSLVKAISAAPQAAGVSYNIGVVEPSELLDYAAPFVPTYTKADLDGNIWVQAAFKATGGIPGLSLPKAPEITLYEVINRAGEMVDRVQLPKGRQIVGFGPGVVYLAAQDSTYVPPSLAFMVAANPSGPPVAPFFLERARIR